MSKPLSRTEKIQICVKLFSPFSTDLPKSMQGCSQHLVLRFMDAEGISIEEINRYCAKRKGVVSI